MVSIRTGGTTQVRHLWKLRAGVALVVTGAVALLAPAAAWGIPDASGGRDSEAHIGRGLELRRSGDDRGALPEFEKAYEIAHTPRAAAQLGLVEQALGRWNDAEAHLAEAIRARSDPWVEKNRATLVVVGGPAGTSIAPTSPTPGSTCGPRTCQIPLGGSVAVVAPVLTDWYFDSWTGERSTAASTYEIVDLARDVTLTALYINQRSERCRFSPPDNAETTDNPLVMTTYSTAGGWSTPATCPWKCLTGFCPAAQSCLDRDIDAIALTGEASGNGWFGGDDTAGRDPRSVGVGQGVTPSAAITMTRFGFNLSGGFKYSSSSKIPTDPVVLELDRRDANGTIQAMYSVNVPPDFKGGWIFWDTPATVLAQGVTTIFTAFLPNAFTQPVNAGVLWSKAAYAGGLAYGATAMSGDLRSWSVWSAGGDDKLFRVQQHNPACQ